MTIATARETRSDDVRWGWRSAVCSALEHDFVLDIEPVSGFHEHLAPLVAPFRVRHGVAPTRPNRYEILRDDEPGRCVLFYNGERVASGRAGRDLAGIFSWHLNQSVIESSVDRHVLLHASAAVRCGMTVILPADQESGKTTTVAGLLREGFEYVTDEAVAIRPEDCAIEPFPKSLSLDAGSWSLFPDCRPTTHTGWMTQWQVPAKALGAGVLAGLAAPPRIIVFPRYVAGARTALEPVTRGEAVQELARMTFHFRRHPQRNLAVLRRVAARARAARLVIGSLDEAVEAVESMVSDTLMEEL